MDPLVRCHQMIAFWDQILFNKDLSPYPDLIISEEIQPDTISYTSCSRMLIHPEWLKRFTKDLQNADKAAGELMNQIIFHWLEIANEGTKKKLGYGAKYQVLAKIIADRMEAPMCSEDELSGWPNNVYRKIIIPPHLVP